MPTLLGLLTPDLRTLVALLTCPRHWPSLPVAGRLLDCASQPRTTFHKRLARGSLGLSPRVNPEFGPLQPSDSLLVTRCFSGDSNPHIPVGCLLLASCSPFVLITVSAPIGALPLSSKYRPAGSRKAVICIMIDASANKWSIARKPTQGERECYATYSSCLVVTLQFRREIVS
jgi:hypothetical protein